MKEKKHISAGQSLITLLFFVIIAVSITAAAVVIIINNSQSISQAALGTKAYYVAESGVENALIRFIRDPSYTGETLPVGSDGTAVATISGTGPYILTSTGTAGKFVKTIQVTINYTNNIASISAWQEQ